MVERIRELEKQGDEMESTEKEVADWLQFSCFADNDMIIPAISKKGEVDV